MMKLVDKLLLTGVASTGALLLAVQPNLVGGGEHPPFEMTNYHGWDGQDQHCAWAHSVDDELNDVDIESALFLGCDVWINVGQMCVSGTDHEPPREGKVPSEEHPWEEGQCGGGS